jgi:hypothetical protein
MFDSYHSHTHTENRAPTDDSIRLADELRDKLLNQMLDSVRVGNNTLEAQVFMKKDDWVFQTRFIVRYKINNQRHQTDVVVDDLDDVKYAGVSEKTLIQIRDAVAKDVAQIITMQIYPTLKGL